MKSAAVPRTATWTGYQSWYASCEKILYEYNDFLRPPENPLDFLALPWSVILCDWLRIPRLSSFLRGIFQIWPYLGKPVARASTWNDANPYLRADFWKIQNDSWKYRLNTKIQYFGFLKYRTFRGSFSAVSKPKFASKYSLESSLRDQQDWHVFAPLSIQNVSQISSNFFAFS